MQPIRTLFSLLLLGIVLLLPESGHAKDKPIHLRLGTLSLQSGSVFQLAKDFGYFQEEGLSTEFMIFPSAQKIALAVASNDLDIGLTGITAAVFNLAGHGKLKMIAGNFREEPGWEGSAIVVSNKVWREGLHHPRQLAGHTLAVTDIGSTLHFTAGRLSDKYAFAPGSIKPIPLHSFPEIFTALATDRVDSSIVPGMLAHRMEKKNNGHIIGWVSEETPWQVTGLLVSSRLLTQDRQTVEKFLHAFRKGSRLYHESFNQVSPEANLKNLVDGKQPLRQVTESMQQFIAPVMTAEQMVRYPLYMDIDARLDLKSVEEQLRWYQEQGMVNRRVTLDQVIDKPLVSSFTTP
ncbi:ABC transporter substrate-binding protein [Kistimonas asteriae]|uniref:ABC transporter substrate-binding protein n=1 Tax=Kistimonas asteriae TaxID=517724 RepID=UPI001BAB1797|nr:ABC transporter substrate-binding protein [Kistimonas asteriae]